MYNVEELTRSLHVHPATARRWRAARRLPKLAELAAKLCLEGELDPISEAWTGWRIVKSSLWSPEGLEWRANTLRAWYVERQLLEELMRGRTVANDAHA